MQPTFPTSHYHALKKNISSAFSCSYWNMHIPLTTSAEMQKKKKTENPVLQPASLPLLLVGLDLFGSRLFLGNQFLLNLFLNQLPHSGPVIRHKVHSLLLLVHAHKLSR